MFRMHVLLAQIQTRRLKQHIILYTIIAPLGRQKPQIPVHFSRLARRPSVALVLYFSTFPSPPLLSVSSAQLSRFRSTSSYSSPRRLDPSYVIKGILAVQLL